MNQIIAQDTIAGSQEIRDTVVQYLTDTIWVLDTPTKSNTICFSFEVSVGDILTIIGFIITVAIFYYQLRAARKDYKTNQRDTWMLNIIIQPYVEHLNELYSNLISEIHTDVKSLKSQSQSQSTSYQLMTNSIAKAKRKEKNSINDFFVHFTALLNATDKKTGTQISNLSIELEDICTGIIDDFKKHDNVYLIRKKVLDNKQKVIGALYASMKSDDHKSK